MRETDTISIFISQLQSGFGPAFQNCCSAIATLSSDEKNCEYLNNNGGFFLNFF